MARQTKTSSDERWYNLQIIAKPQNRAIIQLLSDKKPRMPVEICHELRNRYPKASLYIAMKELAIRNILVPLIIENKKKPWRSLTEILGYTLNEEIFKIIELLDEADKQAKDVLPK